MWQLGSLGPRAKELQNMAFQGVIVVKCKLFLGNSALATPKYCKNPAFQRLTKENLGSLAPLFQASNAMKSSTSCDLSSENTKLPHYA